MLVNAVIAVALFAHGVGHVLLLVPALGLARWADQSGHSWLLNPVLGDGATRAVATIAWGAAMLLFVAGVGGFVAGASWWRAATIAGAVVSAVAIVTFWDGLPTASASMALGFDAIVLVNLLGLGWPSPEIAGS